MHSRRRSQRRRGLVLALLLAVAFLALQTCASSGVTRSPGERMHRAKCGACHLRPEAERFDRKEWTRIIDEHDERVPLTEPERAALLKHLSAHSESPLPSPAPAKNTPQP